MKHIDDSVRFVLPNGTRWVAQADSPMSSMLALVMRAAVNEEENRQARKQSAQTKASVRA